MRFELDFGLPAVYGHVCRGAPPGVVMVHVRSGTEQQLHHVDPLRHELGKAVLPRARERLAEGGLRIDVNT